MGNQVNIRYQTVILQFFIVLVGFLIFSCSQKKSGQQNTSEKKDTLKPPVTIVVTAPFVTLLDTCPPPLTITIPARKEDSFVLKISNSKTVIHTPEIKPADFSVLMTNYNTEQGLENSAVQDGCIDKNGNLWFATFGGGVSRYDGKSFKNYDIAMGLVFNLANCIIEDKDKNLWIGTGAGVSCYNGEFFKNYYTAQGLVNNSVNCIYQDKKGNFWFGTNGGISKYDGKSFTNYTTADGLINNGVNSIFQDKRGNIWCGTDEGASRYDASLNDTVRQGKIFKNYTTNEGLVSNNVKCILEDKNGNLWFGGWGVSRMDPDGSFKNYSAPVELTNNLIKSIHEDKNGNIWFGTWEGGVRLKKDGSLMKFNTDRGLINNRVNRILEDKAGNLWFCTEDGISRFDQNGKFFMAYTTAQGLTNNSVNSFCEDKEGSLWFGTFGGISKLDKDGKTFTNYTTAQGLPHNSVRSMAEDKMGNLWFGTDGGGVCRLDHTRKVFTIYTTSQGLAGNSIRCISEDSNGNLWFGSAGQGVSQLDKEYKSFTTYTTAQGLSTNQVRRITEDKKGNFWFNTLGGGISRLDKDRKYFTNYTTAQGLANNYSWPMIEDKNGNLWIGTQLGLSRFDGKSFTNYTATDGLADGEAGDVIMNKDGVIWLAQNKGFTALKGFAQGEQLHDASYKPALKPLNELSNAELKKSGYKPVFETYGYKTGYPVKAINNIGVTREGAIWAGTGGFLGDKLIHFDFTHVPVNPNPPNVLIQSIKINNDIISWYDLFSSDNPDGPDSDREENSNIVKEPVDSITTAPNITEERIVFGKILSDEQRTSIQGKFSDIKFDSITPFYPLPVNLVLPYQHNNITFDFAAIEPARPYLVRYQYMLEGYDREWSPVSDQTIATFGNIHEGSYTFKLKAQSPDGVWSKPLTYSFKVLPPWYRTWWAYSLYTITFLTAVWIFIRWRIKTLKKEKIILEEKVVKRTHELKEEKEKVESTLQELKATQAQLIQSEKMASLGELTAGIAHEIQNPLNFVNNFSEVNRELIQEMKTELNAGNKQEAISIANDIDENEEKINQHGKRADAIVKGMLQHSRTSSGVKEPADINALVDEYLRLAYHGMKAKDKSFNVILQTDLDASIGKLSVIPQDIGRVLLNLYNNAFYSVSEKKKPLTPPIGGELNILTTYEPTIIVGTKKTGDKVLISVKDNGNGIPQKVLDKIFQPFFTTKPTGQGTGLGLSLSYDIVKAHGGEIKAETKEGEGAEFIIQLPST